MECGFTYRHYREILETAKREGFHFSSFLERPDSQRRIYLRHDVDISIENALEIAAIERESDVRSAFLLQINSHFYNILEDYCAQIIERIASMGHDLGIHFDQQSVLLPDNIDLEDEIRRQYEFMRKYFPVKKIVSFHHPSAQVINREVDIGDFVSTYSPEFLQNYRSDSNRNWRDGCPCELLQAPELKTIQILMHPCWWNEEEWSYAELYQKLLKRNESKLRDGLKETCRVYREIL